MRLVAHLNFFGAQLLLQGGWRLLGKLVSPVLVALVALQFVAGAAAATGTVSVSGLPPEAQQTYRLIHEGGPFPYPKDGIVFGNRERLLPSHVRGYYREYTVITPGSRDRGAKRIVCGGQKPAAPDACFYTQDHYASFRRIAP